MCDLALALLAEKLIDDFYDTDDPSMGGSGNTEDDLKEQLKSLVPNDKWNLLVS